MKQDQFKLTDKLQIIARIAPEAAAGVHLLFEHHYATMIQALPALGLHWRIDVETRQPGQSPAQQHQFVVWHPEFPNWYGVRDWLRIDGHLDNHVGDVLSSDQLLHRITKRWQAWQQQQAWEQQSYAGKLNSHMRRWGLMSLAVIVAFLLALLAWVVLK